MKDLQYTAAVNLVATQLLMLRMSDPDAATDVVRSLRELDDNGDARTKKWVASILDDLAKSATSSPQ